MPPHITHADDSRIPIGIEVPTLKSGKVSYRAWMLPLHYGHLTLKQGNDFLKIVAAPQGKIPEIIRWTEGKDSHLVKEFFYGGVDLQAHDFVHLLLGRGLLPKDEAFVIGFTMGSTNRLATMNKEVFAYIAQHYYPNAYQMDAQSRIIYFDAAKLGYLSDCLPLDQIDFSPYLDQNIDQIRQSIGLFPQMLDAYYRDIEQRRHPNDPASSRLVPAKSPHNPWTFTQDEKADQALAQVAQSCKEQLRRSDQSYPLQLSEALAALQTCQAEIEHTLSQQKDIARMCFDEIKKICQDNLEQVEQDQQNSQWQHFFSQSQASIHASAQSVAAELQEKLWEKEDHHIGKRAYVHALLQRGDNPRDRAFCRGFYDGSSNRKSTYAADMKSKLFAQLPLTLDGRYSPDMQQSYQDGVRMGFISDCTALCSIDFTAYNQHCLQDTRQQLNLTVSILEAYQQEVENKRALVQ